MGRVTWGIYRVTWGYLGTAICDEVLGGLGALLFFFFPSVDGLEAWG